MELQVRNVHASAAASKGLRELLQFVEEPLHIEERGELEPLVNWSGASNLPIHRWYKYREGYSPQLIQQLELGDRIADPFCGCGSILLGAAQSGRSSVGVDINPLASFVAKVKLTPLPAESYRRAATFAEEFEERAAAADAWPEPALRISHKVFEPDISEAMRSIRSALEEVGQKNEKARDFLFLAWLAIFEEVGSYFKEGNGIKYRNKKRTKSGYVRRPEGVWQRKRFGPDQKKFVFERYSRQLEMMLEDAAHRKNGAYVRQKVVNADLLKTNALLREEAFDSIIFSPPYANRFDYFESQKVELWFGNFVDSYQELRDLRSRSLRSHLGADLDRKKRAFPALESFIALMDRESSSWRMGVPLMLRGYFEDMFQTLAQCEVMLDRGGACYVVVGNSAFAGTIIPTDSLIAHLGLEAGFSSAKLMKVRHLTVAPQQRAQLEGLEDFMRESVVVFE